MTNTTKHLICFYDDLDLTYDPNNEESTLKALQAMHDHELNSCPGTAAYNKSNGR